MEDIDLLTPKGHEREERNRRICEVFKKLMPEVERIGNKQWRAVCAIAHKFGLSNWYVRNILVKNNLYTIKTRRGGYGRNKKNKMRK